MVSVFEDFDDCGFRLEVGLLALFLDGFEEGYQHFFIYL
jgi:hypothetical protein